MVDGAGCYQCVCGARLVGTTTFSCRREQHFACKDLFLCIATVACHCCGTLQVGLKKAEDTLSAASKLLSKLADEKASWTCQVSEKSASLATLPARSAVAAALVVYAAGESADMRAALVHSWAALEAVALPSDFSVTRLLASESDIAQWKSEGLQGDSVRFTSHARCNAVALVCILFSKH